MAFRKRRTSTRYGSRRRTYSNRSYTRSPRRPARRRASVQRRQTRQTVRIVIEQPGSQQSTFDAAATMLGKSFAPGPKKARF